MSAKCSGVKTQLGNHILDFVNCSDKILKQTFHSILAKVNLITTLKATIYNYANPNFQKEREFNPWNDKV